MVKSLFEPKSIAVIGASRDERKVGHIILKNLKEGFKGKLFAVNPFADKILGIKCYESLEEINEKIDLGVFAVKAEVVIEILERVENLKNAVIISSGFGEVGNVQQRKNSDSFSIWCFRSCIYRFCIESKHRHIKVCLCWKYG